MTREMLAVDIGGTHTRLALFDLDQTPLEPHFLVNYSSKNFDTFELLYEQFVKDHAKKIHTKNVKMACFGVAGIIDNNICHVTNLPWVLDSKNLEKKMGINAVYILNDLQAGMYGILALPENAFITLKKGEVNKEGTKAVIGAGTGLGEAFAVYTEKGYLAYSTEGGHADFAPRDSIQSEMMLYLKNKLGRVSVEHIVSGQGLWNIYLFLRDRAHEKDPDFFNGVLSNEEKGTKVTEGALKYNDPLCLKALEVFISCYAAESGNLALRFLASGGIYISGGIAPRLIELLKVSPFLEIFDDKGVMENFVSKVPIHVVMDDRSPLFGAAWYCLRCI
ncbi:glucokinase [Chlamydiales bacterium]|nr:glucokinase [Chlamydiales bacterium]